MQPKYNNVPLHAGWRGVYLPLVRHQHTRRAALFFYARSFMQQGDANFAQGVALSNALGAADKNP
jgi:hypothetical protein